MAEDAADRERFLAQLPRDECLICKESCGTVDVDTGASEHAVRLPECGHVVGSKCIALWLAPERYHNSCPLCRHEFFEATEAPDDSYGTIADQAIMRVAQREEDWDLTDLRSWLRTRLDPDAPSTEEEVEEWWRQGCWHYSGPILRRWRRLASPHLRLETYEMLQRSGIPLPPLKEQTDPTGLRPADRMDQSHDDALFAVMDVEGYVAHPYWRAVTRGAPTRELWEMLRRETYVLGRLVEDEYACTAPFLAGWTGFLPGAPFPFPMERLEGPVDEDTEEQDITRPERRSKRSTTVDYDADAEPEDSAASDGDSSMTDALDEDMAVIVEAIGSAEQDAIDDKEYCICHRASEGNMIACDNDSCPVEWFHWDCVGVVTEPVGDWYCPDCRDEALGHMGYQRQE